MTKYTILYQYGSYVAYDDMGNSIWSNSRWFLEDVLRKIGCEFKFED